MFTIELKDARGQGRGVFQEQIIEFSRIKKGSSNKFEHPSMWNAHAIDYKNFTASWKNFTIVSKGMDPH